MFSNRVSYIASDALANSVAGSLPEVSGKTAVLLHGIGSGAASWQAQIEAANRANLKVVAWNAPGYGTSQPLDQSSPVAADYAECLWHWLDEIAPTGTLHLVGHSLGALIAVQAALIRPERILKLTLLSPALGYGAHSPADQDKVVQQRLHALSELGAAGMAQTRAKAMVSANASASTIKAIEQIMAQIHPNGYAQAVRMLASADLLTDLKKLRSQHPHIALQVACGFADTITPPAKCAQAAAVYSTDLISLGDIGHACAIEAPARVNQVLGFE
jgi:pimeloyl-ACP methyl ester carboxylesterase